jgi:hypothetical protein
MDTLMISGQQFKNVTEVTQWVNNLVGRSAPHSSSHVVKRVIHFQVLPEEAGLSVLVLAEVERKKSMSSMVISMRKDLGLSSEE